jgi:hypothetical protein
MADIEESKVRNVRTGSLTYPCLEEGTNHIMWYRIFMCVTTSIITSLTFLPQLQPKPNPNTPRSTENNQACWMDANDDYILSFDAYLNNSKIPANPPNRQPSTADLKNHASVGVYLQKQPRRRSFHPPLHNFSVAPPSSPFVKTKTVPS